MSESLLATVHVNGTQIAFTDEGYGPDKPTVVCLPGWGQDHRAFDRLLAQLLPDRRVVRVCWRGQGIDRTPYADYGIAEQTEDTLALLEILGVGQFVPVSHSHGGWVALELAEGLGTERVPHVLLTDLIMSPPPPEFAASLAALQDPVKWVYARDALVSAWLAGTTNEAVLHHVKCQGGGLAFDTWRLSGEVIGDAYERWGSPMGRMERMSAHPQIRHVFAHPKAPEYDALHEAFRAENPWFSYTRLDGETHFPVVELPERVAEELADLEQQSSAS